MKLFHLSDLHIGKNLYHYNLKEDQEYVLDQIIKKAEELHPDAILIAGDIYDKSMPSAEAVNLFDDFLTRLTLIEPEIPVLIISGNHDSGERLDFASGILKHHKVYLSGKVPSGKDELLRKVTLEDQYGAVHFYMLPFIKPAHVRHLWEDGESKSYDESVKAMIARENIDFERERNVLLTHQFYVNGEKQPELTESETISVGGIDHVDIQAVNQFDYVALGHLHRAQKVGKETIRYCGTLLKYSVSESGHKKSLTVVELKGKGEAPVIQEIPIRALRDVKKKTGTLKEIVDNATASEKNDFVSVILTDENELFMPKEQLQTKFDNILEVRLASRRIEDGINDLIPQFVMGKPLTVFEDFFKAMRGTELSEAQREMMISIFDQVKEDE